MLYLPITKSWIVSAKARMVYMVCAVGSVMFVAVLLTIFLALASAGSPALPQSRPIIVLVKALFVLGSVCMGVLWVGMLYFCFEFDPSPSSKRALWFAALILLGSILAPLYFVLVYRRSCHFRVVPSHRAQAASNSAG